MKRVSLDLESLTPEDDIDQRTDAFVEAWKKAKVGDSAIPTIIRYMEDNPGHDYGSPGALVHFIEHFRSPSYEKAVLASIARKPTAHVLWMLNRLINGAKTAAKRKPLLAALQRVPGHPLVDGDADRQARHFLSFHGIDLAAAAAKPRDRSRSGGTASRFAIPDLIPLLGRSIYDPAVEARFGSDLKKIKRESFYGFLVLKADGFEMTLYTAEFLKLPSTGREAKILHIVSFQLYPAGKGRTCYAGGLPDGLTFSADRPQVIATLGNPVESGGGTVDRQTKMKERLWVGYLVKGIRYNYHFDEVGPLAYVQISRA